MNTFTKLLYMDDGYLLTKQAQVVELKQTEEGKDIVILDQTVFYPQGGGQPYDIGKIETLISIFVVQEVRFIEGLVYHIGFFEKGAFSINDVVTLSVDEKRRSFNRRNHSAGHLIDIAIKLFDNQFIPIKGFHFPDGAYVEYQGLLDETKKEELRVFLQTKVKELIQLNLSVSAKQVQKSELSTYCDFVPVWLPENKPIRIVQMGDNKAHPCGGTHVKTTGEIGSISIEKINSKKGNTRISYSVSPT